MALSWNSGSTTQSGGNPTKASQIGWIRGTNFKKESIKMKVKDWRRSSNIHCADREWLSHHHHPPLICQQNLHVSVLTRDKGWVPSSRLRSVDNCSTSQLDFSHAAFPWHVPAHWLSATCPACIAQRIVLSTQWKERPWRVCLVTVGYCWFQTFFHPTSSNNSQFRPTAYHVGPCRKPSFVYLARWRIDWLTINSSCTARAWPGFSRHWGAQCRLPLFNCNKSSDVSRI